MKKTLLKFVILLTFLILGSTAHAAQLRLEQNEQKVNIFIDTENQNINTIAGEIIFDPDNIIVDDIITGNSVINLWVRMPQETKAGMVEFAGIVTNGFNGSDKIFSVNFSPLREGTSTSTTSTGNLKALLNDGEGTETDLDSTDLEITLSTSKEIKVIDTIPPDPFNAIVTKIPEIGGDKHLIIFSTTDNQSGVDHYEIQEGDSEFKTVESPYVLENQNLDEDITVKALDKNGNEQISQILALNKKSETATATPNNIFLYLLIAIVIITTLIFLNKKHDGMKIKFLSIILGLLFFPITAHAAGLYLSPTSGSYTVGQTFHVGIYLSSPDQAANAAAGTIIFSGDILEGLSATDAGAISFWAIGPSISDGSANFKGVIFSPGYTGTATKIAQLKFKAKSPGTGTISFTSGAVLANDGAGTNITDSLGSASFTIMEKVDEPIPEPELKPETEPSKEPSDSPFEVTELERKNPTYPRVELSMEIPEHGDVSIKKIEIIENDKIIAETTTFGKVQTPPLPPGQHDLQIRTTTEDDQIFIKTIQIEIDALEEIPEIEPLPETLQQSDNLTVTGKTLPNSTVAIFVLKRSSQLLSSIVDPPYTTTTDEYGKFEVQISANLPQSVYDIYIQITDKDGAKTNIEKIGTIKITYNWLARLPWILSAILSTFLLIYVYRYCRTGKKRKK